MTDKVRARALADLMPRLDDHYRAELLNRDVLRFLATPGTEEVVAQALFEGDDFAARLVLDRLVRDRRLVLAWEMGEAPKWIATGL